MTETQQAAVQAAAEPGQGRALALREKKTKLLETVQLGLDEQGPRLQAYLAKLQGDPDRFRATVLQAVSTTPSLIDCTPSSIVIAALEAAQLGLEPTGILGQAYMLPYKNRDKGVTEAKLIVGYRGYIDLLHRAGAVKSIEARVVYEGDMFEAVFGTQKRIRHVPYFLVAGARAGDRVAVYWIAELENETQFDVIPIEEIEKIRKSSKSKDRGPWIDWYDMMAAKSAIRRAIRYLPISVEDARRAISLEDQAEAEAAAEKPALPGTATSSARSRAVALLDGGEATPDSEQAAGEATGDAEPAPAAQPTGDTSLVEERQGAAPVGSSAEEDADLEAVDQQLGWQTPRED